MCDKKEIGIINEIGDLGLGFEPISEDDKEKIKELNDDEWCYKGSGFTGSLFLKEEEKQNNVQK